MGEDLACSPEQTVDLLRGYETAVSVASANRDGTVTDTSRADARGSQARSRRSARRPQSFARWQGGVQCCRMGRLVTPDGPTETRTPGLVACAGEAYLFVVAHLGCIPHGSQPT